MVCLSFNTNNTINLDNADTCTECKCTPEDLDWPWVLFFVLVSLPKTVCFMFFSILIVHSQSREVKTLFFLLDYFESVFFSDKQAYLNLSWRPEEITAFL